MKKAIVVVSSGPIDSEELKLSIERTKNKIRDSFPNYEVRRAFTYPSITEKMAEENGIQTNTAQQALQQLQIEGYQEVIFVSLKEPLCSVLM